MGFGRDSDGAGVLSKFSRFFRPREIFIHNGSAMRRVHVSARAQIGAAGGAMALMFVATFGLLNAAIGASTVSGAVAKFADSRAEVAAMEDKVDSLQADVDAIRTTARTHVAKLEARQAFLAAVLNGEDDASKLAAMLPQGTAKTPPAAADLAAMFEDVDAEQRAMADKVRRAADARYASTARVMAKLGVGMGGMGGPYEPVADTKAAKSADPAFRALFDSWKRLDRLQTGMVAIPSARPVEAVSVNSGFGIRSDPFRGGRAMHAGVDIPGPYATPIYATADGIVGRATWAGGYGRLVEIEHGRGIQTRYGHLSSFLVQAGARVKRGQLIALMGSTGRSTGNHLHYEVRLNGSAVNPMPFLQSSDYLLAMQQRAGTAVGGPVEKAASK